jgi:hypothetical protein
MLAVAVVSAVAVPGGVASAQRTNIVGAGIENCAGAWTGKITFNPRLKNGGASPVETVKIKAVAKVCAGGAPVATLGKVIASVTINAPGANNCANVFPIPPGAVNVPIPFTEQINWNAGVAPTQVAFPSGTITTTVPAAPVTFSATGPTVGGTSYPTAAANQSINTVRTYANIMLNGANRCGGVGLGIASLNIRAAGTNGTF